MQQASLAYGLTPLLDAADLSIERGERICIVGRNGAGKSTLLKVIAGFIELDSGHINPSNSAKISYMPQDPPESSTQTVYDYVAEGLAEIGQKLIEYHHLTQGDMDDNALAKMAQLQEYIDHHQGWQLNMRIEQELTRLDLDADAPLNALSGGWLRRAALAKALVIEPDILLLDEPTNHIDIEMVLWLENFLLDFAGAIVFISHDRRFIRALATRIIDLDRGQLTSWPGEYQTYLQRKEELLAVEEKQNALFDKRLSEEERWIRQGIKARRTRNEGRVRSLLAMREERQNRIQRKGNAKVAIAQQERSGKIIFEGEQVFFQLPEKILIENFDVSLMRGDRIALVGPNGCGKTTLINLLLGKIKPTQGTIRCGTKLDIAYFDQTRAVLDLDKTVMDNVAQGAQDVDVNGRKRHILGYLQDYLFEPARARTPVRSLSGGEKNRLLLAKLFLKPSNLLILDEPTNDLDVETLELLEEKIAEYQGSILLVSHDREFIDKTVTECWWFTGEGHIEKRVGGFSDNQVVMTQKKSPESAPITKRQKSEKPVSAKKKAAIKPKITYSQRKELQSLPSTIESLEAELEALQNQVNDPTFFTQASDVTEPVLKHIVQTQEKLEQAFARWEALEALENEE